MFGAFQARIRGSLRAKPTPPSEGGWADRHPAAENRCTVTADFLGYSQPHFTLVLGKEQEVLMTRAGEELDAVSILAMAA